MKLGDAAVQALTEMEMKELLEPFQIALILKFALFKIS